MSVHVAHAERPVAAPQGHRAAVSAPRQPDPSPAPADRDRGLTLLYVFTGAMAIMVGDVVLAAAIGHMWILVPVMGIHLLMTFAVFAVIMRLLADGEGEVPDAKGARP